MSKASEPSPKLIMLEAAQSITGRRPIARCDEAALPEQAGAYLLLVKLDGRLSVSLGKQPTCRLAAGWYAYAGSAYGPGGIRARVARHFRVDKAPRWHIDQLTQSASAIWAAPAPGRTECALLQAMGARPGIALSIPGFGSSDCRNCSSHLLQCE